MLKYIIIKIKNQATVMYTSLEILCKISEGSEGAKVAENIEDFKD